MIDYILGAFSGGFFVFFIMALFMGRPLVLREKEDELEASYHPDIHRDSEDDWEL